MAINSIQVLYNKKAPLVKECCDGCGSGLIKGLVGFL